MKYVVVIPALEPDKKFVNYIQELLSAGIEKIIVINDGSGSAYDGIFEEISRTENCFVLTHKVNKGKGVALKTAFKFYLKNFSDYKGIITADCDGQHAISDIQRIMETMDEHPDCFVLGCRDFGKETPGKSLIGNRITSVAMRLLYGISLNDTQTGLRGIPTLMIKPLSRLMGNRYEYELNMLIYAKRQCIPFVTIPIQTIYFDNNSASHYRPIIDSARIFTRVLSGLVCFSASAVCSGIVDFSIYSAGVKVFFQSLGLSQKILFASVIARLISSVVNFALNRHMPYAQNKNVSSTMPKYYTLLIVQLFLSYFGVYKICTATGLDEMLVKLIVDLVLALFSYQIQMRWVFCDKTHSITQKKEMI